MMYNPLRLTILLFSTLLLFSTALTLNSTNWLLLWLSLELNMVMFVPMMSLSSNNLELNASSKYFILQATSSIIFLLGIMMSISAPPQTMATHSLMLISLLTKLGAAPGHYWFLQAVNDLPWSIIFFMMTWQKLAPLALILHLSFIWLPLPIFLIIYTNAVVGMLGGISQTQMRPLLAYSAIAHMSWTLTAMLTSYSTMLLYFMVYVLILLLLLHTLQTMNKTSTSQFSLTMAPNLLLMTFMHLLSLSGLPPLLGFFPKWVVLMSITHLNKPLTLVLLLSSLISMIFYLTIFSTTMLDSAKTMTFKHNTSPNSMTMALLLIPTISLMTLSP